MSDIAELGSFAIEREDSLLFPFFISNRAKPSREVLGRETLFSFPLAAVGFALAGPPGVAAGHIVGAVAGFIRHKRIHPE